MGLISSTIRCLNWGVANLKQDRGWLYAQLVPTLLFENETRQQGEIWRLEIVAETSTTHGSGSVWDSFCLGDIDPYSYAGLPVNEIVFWHEDGHLELPAWHVMLKVSEKCREWSSRARDVETKCIERSSLLFRCVTHCHQPLERCELCSQPLEVLSCFKNDL